MARSNTFDSSRLSLKEFCCHSRSGNKLFGDKGKFRDVVDAFRTVYWFHDLRIAIGEQSCYGMEMCLEPGGAVRISRKDDASPYMRSKWNKYRKGRNTPSLAMVSAVNQRCEGSRFCFRHVLWDVLRLELPVHLHGEEWIGRLAPEIQSQLWKSSKKNGELRTRRQKLGLRQFTALSHMAGLDALACLTLLLREAHAESDEHYAFELSRWLCRIFVMVGEAHFYGHGLALPLYEFYEQAILPLGACQGLRYSLQGVNFLNLLGELSHRLYHLKGVDPEGMTILQKNYYMDGILSGSYGYDYVYLFSPIPVPVDVSIQAGHPLQVYSKAENELRMWALRSIRSGGNERFPPTELIMKARAAEIELKQYWSTTKR